MSIDACCPNCGHHFIARAQEPLTPAQELERACRERGLPVTIDGRVSEQVAAELLGRAVGTLQNWAYQDQPLPFVKVRGSRTYRLSDIAEMLAGGN